MRLATLATMLTVAIAATATANLLPALPGPSGGGAGPYTGVRPAPVQTVLVFTGRVTDTGRAPIAGARVRIDALGVEGTTGQDGRYHIPVPGLSTVPARVTLIVTHDAWAPVAREVPVRGDTVRADFALLPAPGQPAEQERNRDAREGRGSLTAAVQRRLEAAGIVRQQNAALPASKVAAFGVVAADRADPDFNTESYGHFAENPFLAPAHNPLSTFSIDVDRASYANIRRFIEQGQRPPIDAVRIEEMINYFAYDHVGPRGDAPFAITTELAAAPWAPNHHLLRIGL